MLSRDIFEFWLSSFFRKMLISTLRIGLYLSASSTVSIRVVAAGLSRKSPCSASRIALFSTWLDPKDAAHCATRRVGVITWISEPAMRFFPQSKTTRQRTSGSINYSSIRDQLREQARSEVATLNIGKSYKSRDFKDWPMLAALPSSRMCLIGQSVCSLKPKQVSESYMSSLAQVLGPWIGEPVGSLFCPPCGRGAFMKKDEMRRRVTEAVQNAVLHE